MEMGMGTDGWMDGSLKRLQWIGEGGIGIEGIGGQGGDVFSSFLGGGEESEEREEERGEKFFLWWIFRRSEDLRVDMSLASRCCTV